ncbi:MAG: HIT domain-containing protein [Candidatus Caldarchaeum sp.]|uniref:HIT domain-containing protein n=1 Tax=Caldiarchaeum subterraneum TaxID=311458 RepID=A0A7C4E0T9_CALS0|nr:HIT domain-containing protein [Candidatus Caldarchaeales archaeon]MDJ0273018.1 HIT domain-containing protein [Candidatus Caldarchaeales archaeon]
MDRLYAPWRMAYIKEGKSDSGCVFCLAAEEKDDRKRYVVHRGKKSFVIMNIYPYNNGHVMITPFRHVGSLEELDDEEMLEMMQLIKWVVKVINNIMRPEGFNIGANIGKSAGAGIEDHIHFHVVPRWRGDTNFMTVVSNTRVLPETVDQTYERLLNAKRSFPV